MILCSSCSKPIAPGTADRNCAACGAIHAVETDLFSFIPENERRADVGYSDSFFEVNLARENRHFWFLGRNAAAVRLVRKYAPPGARMLEIGCGTGNILRRLGSLGFKMEGADVSLDALRLARSRYAAPYTQADIARLPFVEHFQAAGLFDVLEHIDDDAHALSMIRRALEPEGLLFLTVPAGERLFSDYDELLCHKRRYDMAPLLEKIATAGFSVLKATHFFFFLYPLLALARKNRNPAAAPADPQARLDKELHIYPVVNEVFRAVMACEAQLLRFASFPVGGSIAIAARRVD